MQLLAKTSDSIPFIFLITDGAVEDEREICTIMKGYLTSAGSVCPRISTFGIGKDSFSCFDNCCNLDKSSYYLYFRVLEFNVSEISCQVYIVIITSCKC